MQATASAATLGLKDALKSRHRFTAMLFPPQIPSSLELGGPLLGQSPGVPAASSHAGAAITATVLALALALALPAADALDALVDATGAGGDVGGVVPSGRASLRAVEFAW